ncbi:hypothetical protein MBLNU230_g7277t1 [Neophaeotheca triangularis]
MAPKKRTNQPDASTSLPADKRTKFTQDVRTSVKRSPKVDGPTFGVIVSNTEKRYDVHEELLKQHSDFFRAAIDGGFKETTDRVVKIPGSTTQAFDTFCQFLLTGKIFMEEGDSYAQAQLQRTHLVLAWHLGEYLLSISFKDAVVDALTLTLVESIWWYPTWHRNIYCISSGSSGIRKLLVDEAVHGNNTKESLERMAEEGKDHEFFFDVAAELVKWKKYDRVHHLTEGYSEPGSYRLTCAYHEHLNGKGKCCYKEMFSIA